MSDNGKVAMPQEPVQSEPTPQVEQMIIETDVSTGRVAVRGFPNNFRAAKQRIDGAMLALAEFFLHSASRGLVDADGNYTGSNVDESEDTKEVINHYLDMAARGGAYQAIDEIENRKDRELLRKFLCGVYMDISRSDNDEYRPVADAFLSTVSPDNMSAANYWADRIAKRREELRA